MTGAILTELRNKLTDAEAKRHEAHRKHESDEENKHHGRAELAEEMIEYIETLLTEPESVYGDFFDRLGGGE